MLKSGKYKAAINFIEKVKPGAGKMFETYNEFLKQFYPNENIIDYISKNNTFDSQKYIDNIKKKFIQSIENANADDETKARIIKNIKNKRSIDGLIKLHKAIYND
jgi:hypothetical protein